MVTVQKEYKVPFCIKKYTMKKLLLIIPITVVIAVIFGAMLAASIGTLESVYAQTNATNTTTNGNQSDVTTASEIEGLTEDNTSDIGGQNTGLTQGLEKEQTADTAGNMTAADETAGQNATTTTTAGGGGANTTTTANNTTANNTTANDTTANETSSQNNTGNPLSNIPIIGELFK
jgi:hypothetical protein